MGKIQSWNKMLHAKAIQNHYLFCYTWWNFNKGMAAITLLIRWIKFTQCLVGINEIMFWLFRPCGQMLYFTSFLSLSHLYCLLIPFLFYSFLFIVFSVMWPYIQFNLMQNTPLMFSLWFKNMCTNYLFYFFVKRL